MQCLRRCRLLLSSSSYSPALRPLSAHRRSLSSRRPPSSSPNSDDEWNDAWETAWLPEDLSAKNRAPWETDVNFPDSHSSPSIVLPSDADPDTKAFIEEMDERWDERRMAAKKPRERCQSPDQRQESVGHSAKQVVGNKKDEDEDYRLKKQRIHAGLWMKEIEKMEESRLGDMDGAAGGDIDRLLDSCAEIFDSGNNELSNTKIPSTSEFKTKPDGWETTSKAPDGNIWEVTQREEDILLQEFDRRIAFSKFQIASFIKTHIFSRRRPIDGWKYMIEELGPNARKGKGTVQRVPALADPSTQPFREEKTAIGSNFATCKGR